MPQFADLLQLWQHQRHSLSMLYADSMLSCSGGGLCMPCPSGCAACDGPDSCTVCRDNKFLNSSSLRHALHEAKVRF